MQKAPLLILRVCIYAFSALWLAACGGQLSIPENYLECGSPHGGTICHNPEQHCVDGLCVWRDARCSPTNPEGPCSDGPNGETRVCVEGACQAPLPDCSPEHQLGRCPENQYCNLGTCMDAATDKACSETVPNGFCGTGKLCFDGTCFRVSEDELCNEDNPEGICPRGKHCEDGQCIAISYGDRCSYLNPNGLCDAWETCVDGICSEPKPPDACFPTNPDGRCPAEKVCVAGQCQAYAENPCTPENPTGLCAPSFGCNGGECVPIEDFPCSAENQQGLCPAGQICIRGECDTPLCSSEYPYGKCNDNNQYCDSGSCVTGPCSEAYPEGLCDEDRYCQNGSCLLYECSKEHPNGTCPRGQECEDGSCKDFPCSQEHPNGGCTSPDEICVNDRFSPLFGTCTPECSDANSDGWCPTELECIGGSCRSPCPTDIYCGENYQCCNYGEVCAQGACVPKEACTPNEIFCVDPLHLAKCDSSGDLYAVVENGNCIFACDSNAVPPVCSCSGNDQCYIDQHCESGACTEDICQADALFCTDSFEIATCDGVGSSYSVERSCYEGCEIIDDKPTCSCESGGDISCLTAEFCDSSFICAPDICTEGEYECVGDDVYRCSDNGSESMFITTCDKGFPCVSKKDEGYNGTGCGCDDDWDCPESQACNVNFCQGTINQCRLAAKPFSQTLPQIEIQWGGKNQSDPYAYGSPFSHFSQTVMTPLVINLDDDSGDGDINELDFPEIVFVAFDVSGNYYDSGMLRAIHGGGPEKGLDYFAACGTTTWNQYTCGDGVCEQAESDKVCSQDCPKTCGDGECNASDGEDYSNCPKDCLVYAKPNTCGNGSCEIWESSAKCGEDCPGDFCTQYIGGGNFCHDGPGEFENEITCPGDCGPEGMPDQICGDHVCTAPYETAANCSIDCVATNNECESKGDLDSTANLAAGDLNGDGKPEIVAITRSGGYSSNSYIRVYDNRGHILLTADGQNPLSGQNHSFKGSDGDDRYKNGSPMIADLDHSLASIMDPEPAEIIMGDMVWRLHVDGGTWNAVWRYNFTGGAIDDWHVGEGNFGPSSCVADILLHGENPVIIAGDTAYRLPLKPDGLVSYADCYPGSAYENSSYCGDELDLVWVAREGVVVHSAYSTNDAPSSRDTLTIDQTLWSDDQFVPDHIVRIASGPYEGFVREISGNTSSSLTVSRPFPESMAEGTSFVISAYSQRLGGSGGEDGFCAVADMLGKDGAVPRKYGPNPISPDGRPEVVLIPQNNRVYLIDGPTGSVVKNIRPPSSQSNGGPPNIADFDNDGFPEIGYADQYRYYMLDFQPQDDCNTDDSMTDVDVCSCPAWNTCGDEYCPNYPNCSGPMLSPEVQNSSAIRHPSCTYNAWCNLTQDGSSKSTGSSVFDLNGDGNAEVIYNDECFFRVYTGKTGEVLYMAESSSRTRTEYPIIADADNDGNAEIIFGTSNESNLCDSQGGPNSIYDTSKSIDFMSNNGLEMWGDPSDAWVSSRRIWNQHAYHITNITESGFIPPYELNSWTYDNSYRRNRQSAITGIPAPDLVAVYGSVSGEGAGCGDLGNNITIGVKIKNNGELRVGPGVAISYFGYWADGHTDYLRNSQGDILAAYLENTLEPERSVVINASYDAAHNSPNILPEEILIFVDDPVFGSHEAECNDHALAENNNTTLVAVESGGSQAELTVEIQDIDAGPCQGCNSAPWVDIIVRNTGTKIARNFDVTFYQGDPKQGAKEIHRIIIEELEGGQSTTIEDIVVDGAGTEFPGFPYNKPVRIFAYVNDLESVIECNPGNNIDGYSVVGCYCGG